MATRTTVEVTCDHCGQSHYQGLARKRPEHIKVTFWSGTIAWNPNDLCKPCVDKFLALVSDFGSKHGVEDDD